jgi:5-methylcytosine-specific restriction endonuclease McrA
VSASGRRCSETRDLEFDHIEPYAQGGTPSVANVRLLCRVHNQYEAERTFGVEFMRRKREAASQRPAEARAAMP